MLDICMVLFLYTSIHHATSHVANILDFIGVLHNYKPVHNYMCKTGQIIHFFGPNI